MGGTDQEVKSIQNECDWSIRSPSTAVINAIAAIENVEPIDLSVTLYDYIDPEALDAVVTNDRDITVSFTLGEYRIQVDWNGVIIIID